MTRREIPWLKIFLDNDTRYAQFLCPSLADTTGVSRYLSECPYGSDRPADPPSRRRRRGGPVRAVGAGRCLDVPNASTDQRHPTGDLGLQRRHQPDAGPTPRANNSPSTATNASTPPASGTTNGTRVIIWDCTGTTNQQWNVNANGTITGAQSGLCLDVNGGSTANGALAQLWACNSGSNQQWRLG